MVSFSGGLDYYYMILFGVICNVSGRVYNWREFDVFGESYSGFVLILFKLVGIIL